MRFIVGTNTYFDVEEADSLVNELYSSDSAEGTYWSGLDEEGKQRLIVSATRLIENFQFLGYKVQPYLQVLSFPRFIQYKIVDCPDDIKYAILQQGIRQGLENNSESGQMLKLLESGVRSYKVKDASVEFSSGVVDSKTLPHRLSNGVYEDVYQSYLLPWVY